MIDLNGLPRLSEVSQLKNDKALCWFCKISLMHFSSVQHFSFYYRHYVVTMMYRVNFLTNNLLLALVKGYNV